VVDGPTPATVMDPAFFPGQADTAQVIGPLADGSGRKRAAGRLTWTSALDGVYADPIKFRDFHQMSSQFPASKLLSSNKCTLLSS